MTAVEGRELREINVEVLGYLNMVPRKLEVVCVKFERYWAFACSLGWGSTHKVGLLDCSGRQSSEWNWACGIQDL